MGTNRKTYLLLVLVVVLSLAVSACIGNRTRRTRKDPLSSAKKVSSQIKSLAREPTPAGLTPEEAIYYREFTRLLLELGGRLDAIVAQAEKTTGYDHKAKIQEAYARFNQQVGQLQGRTIQYAEVSGVIKSKHESAKRMMNNIR
jgi:predicted small secreted protein